MSARRGSHRIERLPSARGPHSMRPWNQPTTLPSAMAAAVRRQSSPSSAMSSTAQPAARSRPRAASSSAAISARRKLRAPIGVVHDEATGVAAELVPDRHRPRRSRRRHRRPRIARRRGETASCAVILPLATEFIAQPPASAMSLDADALVQRVEQMEERLLVHRLHRAGDVAVPLLERIVRAARAGPSSSSSAGENRSPTSGAAACPLIGILLAVMAEIVEIERECAVRCQLHDLAHLAAMSAARHTAPGP